MILEPIFDKIILPIIDEKISAYRTRQNFEDAVELLAGKETATFQKGISTIQNLVKGNAFSIQEAIDAVTDSLMKHIGVGAPYDEAFNPAIRSALLFLSSLPKRDVNNWPYNVELPNIRLQKLAIHCVNFENFVMYDSEFIQTDFSRSSFRNCDLGGCQFVNKSSVEWCDFANARMNVSFLTGKATTFADTLLWGSNLETADIARCRIQVVDGTCMEKVHLQHKEAVEFLN
jgi:hypothetical protein